MANTKSAKKRIRQGARRRVRNSRIRTRARSSVRDARKAIESGEAPSSQAAVQAAIRQLDRAVSKGVIHPNNAARRKSRLHKRLAQLKAAGK